MFLKYEVLSKMMLNYILIRINLFSLIVQFSWVNNIHMSEGFGVFVFF